jgi:hypothetical protein
MGISKELELSRRRSLFSHDALSQLRMNRYAHLHLQFTADEPSPNETAGDALPFYTSRRSTPEFGTSTFFDGHLNAAIHSLADHSIGPKYRRVAKVFAFTRLSFTYHAGV